jgi:hypothetical protein
MLRMVPLPFQGRKCGCDDVVDDGFEVAKHFSRWDTQDCEAPVFEPAIPHGIALGQVAPIMCLAVHFDDQSGGMAEEVGGICSSRMLFAKLKASRPLSEFLPEKHFGQRHLSAQLACQLDRAGRALQQHQILP